MSKMQLLQDYLNERLTAVAVEIFGAVENTIAEYQEEISRSNEEIERLRRLLDLVCKPDIQRPDTQQLILPVPEEEVLAEKQHCEQEWSPSLDQEDTEPTQIKEEQEEFGTSQEEEQLQGLESDIKEFIFSLPCVKSDYDQDPPQPLYLYQNQTVENREGDSLPTKTTEDIKTELDGEGYGVYEPNNELNPFSPVNSGRSAAHIGNRGNGVDSGGLMSGLQPLKSKTTWTKKGQSSKTREASELNVPLRAAHSGERPHRCPVCRKCFLKSSILKTHQRIHTGEKPYCCNVCGKSFREKRTLTSHRLTHSGEKPYQCKECGKCFSQKKILTIHMRTHTGEKPYQCKECGKCFTHSGSQAAHLRIHTGERPYKCPMCVKCFRTASHLKRHQRSHRGEQPHC
ncbi:zinc finger protein with KRAB and SCAN domains 8-like [Oncorhynchus kisutch]|uniref:Zinc finger protein with KRAB and SCAN domains 8-like n=1 Tax=Oncorhynchus kisutch TaxID=8019 RepID=A0A8C7FH05_ONCKI|nr:zinc finger protein with KRAB and SCAN domains 8-like [Oncorhynchus kisutch]